MALVFANSVWVSVTSTGTSALSLGAAVGTSADFTSIASGSQVGYRVQDPSGAWEVGQGTYTSGSPGTLSRDTVESSSNAGALVSLAAGAQVFVTPTAGTLPLPALATPLVNGTGALGTSTRYARGDHVHPTDTSRVDQAGFRNVLINGNMDWWQRATSFTTAGVYTADRWLYSRDGSGATVTISRQAATEAALLNSGITWWLNYACTVAGSGGTSNQIVQKVEGVRTLSGRQVTLSFWAKATASVSVIPQLEQYFGTGGSPSAAVFYTGSAVTVTTTPQRFTFTTTLATIAGLTRGSNGDDALWAALYFPNNTVANISITGVQLEVGGVATPIERRPEEVEFALCQRYYASGSGISSFYAASASANWWEPISFGTAMRATPTLVVTPSGGSNYSSVTAVSGGTSGFVLLSVSAALGAGAYNFNFTANAEL